MIILFTPYLKKTLYKNDKLKTKNAQAKKTHPNVHEDKE